MFCEHKKIHIISTYKLYIFEFICNISYLYLPIYRIGRVIDLLNYLCMHLSTFISIIPTTYLDLFHSTHFRRTTPPRSTRSSRPPSRASPGSHAMRLWRRVRRAAAMDICRPPSWGRCAAITIRCARTRAITMCWASRRPIGCCVSGVPRSWNRPLAVSSFWSGASICCSCSTRNWCSSIRSRVGSVSVDSVNQS